MPYAVVFNIRLLIYLPVLRYDLFPFFQANVLGNGYRERLEIFRGDTS